MTQATQATQATHVTHPSYATPSTPMTSMTSQGGRNTLALVSLLCSLIFPLGIVINVLSAVALANHVIPQRAMMILLPIGGGVGTLGLPAMIAAIVTGHVALVMAKRYTRSGARRWMAILGLALGYLSLLAFLGVMALFIVAGMHGF